MRGMDPHPLQPDEPKTHHGAFRASVESNGRFPPSGLSHQLRPTVCPPLTTERPLRSGMAPFGKVQRSWGQGALAWTCERAAIFVTAMSPFLITSQRSLARALSSVEMASLSSPSVWLKRSAFLKA